MSEDGLTSTLIAASESRETLSGILTAWSFALIGGQLDEVHQCLKDVVGALTDRLFDLGHL